MCVMRCGSSTGEGSSKKSRNRMMSNVPLVPKNMVEKSFMAWSAEVMKSSL